MALFIVINKVSFNGRFSSFLLKFQGFLLFTLEWIIYAINAFFIAGVCRQVCFSDD